MLLAPDVAESVTRIKSGTRAVSLNVRILVKYSILSKSRPVCTRPAPSDDNLCHLY